MKQRHDQPVERSHIHVIIKLGYGAYYHFVNRLFEADNFQRQKPHLYL
jgi:hypothetical protein